MNFVFYVLFVKKGKERRRLSEYWERKEAEDMLAAAKEAFPHLKFVVEKEKVPVLKSATIPLVILAIGFIVLGLGGEGFSRYGLGAIGVGGVALFFAPLVLPKHVDGASALIEKIKREGF